MSTRYATLVCSLPHLEGDLFSQRQTPLSRFQLDRRLALLEAADRSLLNAIEDLLQWDRLHFRHSDAEITRRAAELLPRLPGTTLPSVVTSRLETRSLVAALRRRQLGLQAPLAGEEWGHGPHVDRVRRSWKEPCFGLAPRHAWLPRARELLVEGRTYELERHLLQIAWQTLVRQGEPHHFDLEAVVIYVLRWNIVARWTSSNSFAAGRRLETLIGAGLGRWRRLFEAEETGRD